MDIRQLRYVVRIGETGHLRKAAEAEFIAPSAMSAHLKRLENQLGVALFSREPTGLVPTPAGRHFIAEAQAVLAGLETLRRDTIALAGKTQPELVVGFFGGAVNELTHAIFDGFVSGLPGRRLRFVELTMAGQFEDVLNGEVDIALMCLPAHDERLTVTPLFEEPRLVAVPAGSEFAEASELTCSDVMDEAFAVPISTAPKWWSSYWALDDERGTRGRIGARVATVSETIAAVAYSHSVDTVPAGTARRFSHPGVAYRPLRDGGITTTGLVRRTRSTDPALQQLERIASTLVTDMISVVPDAVVPVSTAA